MKTKLNLLVVIFLLGGSLLAACGGGSAPATEAPAVAAPVEIYAGAPAAGGGFAPQDALPQQADASTAKEEPASSADLPDGPVYNVGASPDESTANFAAAHMIIKNADIKLLVEDTDVAIDRATQVVGDAGGYIISSRAWYQPHLDGENYKFATITIGVPVVQFERTLSKLRGLAIRVLDETASGDDVTDQYVDLQSQLTNLEATRDRIKSFLDQAKTVDEALRINQELSNIEAQIEQIKGQMNYLQDRSSYSTITINFEPKLPEITPTPTVTATATATPLAWNPGSTFKESKDTVTRAYQGIVDFLIWLFVAIIPIVAPPAFIIWVVWKLLTRKPNKPAQ